MGDAYNTPWRANDEGRTGFVHGGTSTLHPLPFGKFPLETHFAVLRRFMSLSGNGVEPVTPEAVEAQGVPPDAAVRNVAFLGSLGLLIEEKPGRFKPTPVAMQLINTQLADEQRGRRLLRSLIEKTWFAAAAKPSLETGSAARPTEKQLLAALGAANHLPAGQEEAALRVLIQYLVYTGLLIEPVPGAPGTDYGLGHAPSAAQDAPSVTAPASRRTRPRRRRGSHATHEAGEWELIQTTEFSLRIRANAAAVKRLREQLDLLDEKLARGT